MKIITIILLSLLLLTGCIEGRKNKHISNDEKIKDSIKAEKLISTEKKNTIPDELSNFINKNLSDCIIPSLNDYINEWKSFYEGNGVPYFISADFNGDHLNDYALLLITNEIEVNLFVFEKTNDFFKYSILMKGKLVDKKIPLIIDIEEKGKWEAIDEVIFVPNDGINIQNFYESKDMSFYWEDNEYIRFLYD